MRVQMDGTESALVVVERPSFSLRRGKFAWLEVSGVTLLERDTGICLRRSLLRRWKSFSIELSESSSSLLAAVLEIVVCACLIGRLTDKADDLAAFFSPESPAVAPCECLVKTSWLAFPASPRNARSEAKVTRCCRACAGRFSGMLRDWVCSRWDRSWERLRAAARVPAPTEVILASDIFFFLGLSIRSWRCVPAHGVSSISSSSASLTREKALLMALCWEIARLFATWLLLTSSVADSVIGCKVHPGASFLRFLAISLSR